MLKFNDKNAEKLKKIKNIIILNVLNELISMGVASSVAKNQRRSRRAHICVSSEAKRICSWHKAESDELYRLSANQIAL